MSTAIQLLQQRIEQLDSVSTPGPTLDTPWDRLVWVMSSYTNTALLGDGHDLTVESHTADELVSASLLLRRLSRGNPEIVKGPLDRSSQIWIGIDRSTAGGGGHLSRGLFNEPPLRISGAGAVSEFGLFTCSLTNEGRGMWQIFLEPYKGSDIFPLPWTIWRVPIQNDAVVAEISSAADWVGFVERYPRRIDNELHPDWTASAADYDGVHITLNAVVATQSWYLRPLAGKMLIAPSYWDIETTFWLRWKLQGQTLVDVTHAP